LEKYFGRQRKKKLEKGAKQSSLAEEGQAGHRPPSSSHHTLEATSAKNENKVKKKEGKGAGLK